MVRFCKRACPSASFVAVLLVLLVLQFAVQGLINMIMAVILMTFDNLFWPMRFILDSYGGRPRLYKSDTMYPWSLVSDNFVKVQIHWYILHRITV